MKPLSVTEFVRQLVATAGHYQVFGLTIWLLSLCGGLLVRNPRLDAECIDDVILGCANQAGEDNRNVARMATLLAGLPQSVSGTTINRLCGSGLDALGFAARAIKAGDGDLLIAGGVESMSRAPFVMGKATSAFLVRLRCLIPLLAGDL